MSEVKVNKISPRSGTDVTLGDSGDTFTIPSGAVITNSGTANGFGGDNTPSFSGTLASDTSITTATWTRLPFDTAEWDTDSALDITTNKGRFTVPAGEGGKYVFHGGAGGFTGGDGWELMRLALYKNGALQTDGGHGYVIEVIPYGGTGWDTFLTLSATMLLSAADYVELYVYQNLSTSNTVTGVTYFSGFKLVGV
jgi:hypothetical protein